MSIYDIEWPYTYQVSMVQEYLSQQVINRFFYNETTLTGVGLQALASAFYVFWNTYAAPIQSQDCIYKSVRVLEMWGAKQQLEYIIVGGNGSQGVAELPAFFASYFMLQPLDTRVKKGRKALAGVLEEMIDGNNIAAAYVTDFNDFASAMVSGLLVSGKILYPVILSPANTRHLDNIETRVIEAAWRSWSTQSSRKAGRGA